MSHLMKDSPMPLNSKISIVEQELGLFRISNIKHSDDWVSAVHISEGGAYVCNVESFSLVSGVSAS